MLRAGMEAEHPNIAQIEWANGVEGDTHFTLRGHKYEYGGDKISREGGPHDGMTFYVVKNEAGEEVWVTDASPGEYMQVFMRKEAVAAGFAS